MKKFFVIAMFTMLMMSCGSAEVKDSKDTNDTINVEVVATDAVPAAATDVVPCAAPGPDAGGKVATEVILDSVAK